MDQPHHRDRSPSGSQQNSHITQLPSQSSPPPFQTFTTDSAMTGLGLGLDHQQHQQQQQQRQQSGTSTSNQGYDSFTSSTYLHPTNQQANLSDPNLFDPSRSFDQSTSSYGAGDATSTDFSLFPTSNGSNDQYNATLFNQSTISPNNLTNMTSPQAHHSPTPPQLLQPDALPGSAHQSPSFNQTHFSSPPSHSRHASLGPEAAFFPNQSSEWSRPQFQGHRRTPSEFSDVSSVAHSPNLVSNDSFDADPSGHSPLQQPSDGNLYQEVLGIGSFSLSDPQHHGRSPSHSPSLSPALLPQQLTDMNQHGMMSMEGGNDMYNDYTNIHGSGEMFPTLQQNLSGPDVSQMAPPAINIDFAPNSRPVGFENHKSAMDQDSLTPPNRGTLLVNSC